MAEPTNDDEVPRPDAGLDQPTATTDATNDQATTAPDPRRHKIVVALGGAGAAFALAAAILVTRPQPIPPVSAAPTRTIPPSTSATAPATTTTAEETTTTSTGVTSTTRKPRLPPTGPPGPLTGAPVDQAGYERRPALVLKIDNYDPDARPQAGLTLADIVYEEKVEGPYSRFAAVFQGSDAEQIGPIRSARSTDVQIVGPLARPLFGYSGANGGFMQLLSISPLIDVGAGARGGAYYRGGDKMIPHNLYTSTAMLYGGMSGFVPQPLWQFRGPKDPPGPGAQAATSVTYHFGGQLTLVTWTWSEADRGWMRVQNGSTHYDMDNWPVAAANVVIQYVPYADSIADDMFGNPIPEAELGGTGRGWVMTGGAAVPMTWSRFELEKPTGYFDPNGDLIRFAPGRTWVILVPVEIPATVRFANGGAAS